MSSDTIKELQEENGKLIEEIKKLQEDRIEFASHKIYKKAQTMFFVGGHDYSPVKWN